MTDEKEPSLWQTEYEGEGLNVAVSISGEEDLIPEAFLEEVLHTPSRVPSQEVSLVIQPCEDPSLVLRFFQDVQGITDADIALFTSTSEGTVIKVALRKPIPIEKIVMEMEEVEEASPQKPLQARSNGHIPLSLGPAPGKPFTSP